jgi:hypothetical protein
VDPKEISHTIYIIYFIERECNISDFFPETIAGKASRCYAAIPTTGRQ